MRRWGVPGSTRIHPGSHLPAPSGEGSSGRWRNRGRDPEWTLRHSASESEGGLDMRTAFLVMLITVAVTAGPALAADESDTQNSAVGGVIPELCQIGIAGDLSGLLTLAQDGSGELAYDAGFVASTAAATTLTLDANKSWQLGVHYLAPWSCPGAYNKAESDLLIKITNSPTGTIRNGYAGYVSPPDTKQAMLDHTAGVSNNTVQIQTEVLLDWTKDIPGTYAITLVYTMETTTP